MPSHLPTRLQCVALAMALSAGPSEGQAPRGPRRAPPDASEVAAALQGVVIDTSRVVAATAGNQPMLFAPADLSGVAGLRVIEAGVIIGFMQAGLAAAGSGLAPGTYALYAARINDRWRVFAEAEGRVVAEARDAELVPAPAATIADGQARFSSLADGFAWEVPLPRCFPALAGMILLQAGERTLWGPREVLTVSRGRAVPLRVALLDDCGRPLALRPMQWSVSNPEVVRLVEPAGTLVAAEAGVATVSVTEPHSGLATVVVVRVRSDGGPAATDLPEAATERQRPARPAYVLRVRW